MKISKNLFQIYLVVSLWENVWHILLSKLICYSLNKYCKSNFFTFAILIQTKYLVINKIPIVSKCTLQVVSSNICVVISVFNPCVKIYLRLNHPRKMFFPKHDILFSLKICQISSLIKHFGTKTSAHNLSNHGLSHLIWQR